METKNLEKKIDYKFADSKLLKEALTHRSYINENPSWSLPHNERLEFLGDAVLELIVTEELYNRFPHNPEGKLTTMRAALVNYQHLAKIAKEIGIESYIFLSKGEAKDVGRAREVILANTMEALIGAMYLDSTYAKAKKFINKFIVSQLGVILKNGDYRDPKSLLQEKVQASRKITPSYKVIEETGPEHKKTFKVGVYFGEKLIATGEGYSKQEGELEAARSALENLS